MRPLAQTHTPRPAEAQPLAGSAAVWWRDGLALGGQAVDASETPAAFSAPRVPVCGVPMDGPRIMGILNVTPDSFSDGGRHLALTDAVARARDMAAEAAFIDIGGESTRPGAREVPVDEEIARTAPVIRAIRAEGITTPISIDTRKAKVAEAALEAGADMVNDVTALRYDPDMARLVADRGVPVCLMHSVADPETMQQHARYSDVVAEVHAHLAERIEAALKAGVGEASIIVDPGIGFGKTLDHNLDLLRNLTTLHSFGLPVLLGASRKRFIGTLSGAEAADARMPGSLAVALHGAAQGVQILRVHDTAETRQALLVQQAIWHAGAGQDNDS
ncbi:dihydropteroate synthase [Oceanicola sp. 22II-s10i]|nr:dihydropteroate synthase [Oceanicola sp. 22II-s10i]